MKNIEDFCVQLERIWRLYSYNCPTYREYMAAAGMIRMLSAKHPENVAIAESFMKEIFAGKDYSILS